MTITSTFNPQRGWFERRVTGQMLASEVGGAITAMVTSHHWDKGKDRLILIDPLTDMSKFTLEAMRSEVTPVLARHKDKLTGRHKAAVVASGYGHDIIAQMYRLVPENQSAFTYRNFATEDEAIAWLES